MPIPNQSSNDLSKVQPQKDYNPYLHGTNQSIFALLSRTNYEIKSPLKMLRDDKVAPLTGELGSGFEYLNGRIDATVVGETSLGRLKNCDYNLNVILRHYANLKTTKGTYLEYEVRSIKSRVSQLIDTHFKFIDKFALDITRARLLGKSIYDILTEDEIQSIEDQITYYPQVIYLLGLLGSQIFSDFEAVAELDFEEEHKRYILKECYTPKRLAKRIKELGVDVKAVYENPTPENIAQVMEVLKLPSEVTVNLSTIGRPDLKTFSLPEGFQPFTTIQKSMKPIRHRIDSAADQVVKYGILGGGFETTEKMIASYLTLSSYGDYTAHQEFELVFNALKRNDLLNIVAERGEMLLNIIRASDDEFKLDREALYYINGKEIPIILVVDEGNAKGIYSHIREYRSSCPLKFGDQIRMIATDTHENRIHLMRFLEDHELMNVEVVLFDDLKKSLDETHTKPQDKYHHADGVQRLSWFAAKAAIKDPKNIEKLDSKVVELSEQEEDLLEDALLLEAANIK